MSSPKRRFIVILLTILALVRLAIWNQSRQDALNLCSLATPGGPKSLSVSGALVALPNGPAAVYQPFFEIAGFRHSFSGTVTLGPGRGGPESGQRVEISGPFRCATVAQNPARLADAINEWREPRLVGSGGGFRVRARDEPSPWFSRLANGFNDWLRRSFAGQPGLLAFLQSVWTGDDRGLPESLREFFKEAGVLQILALSGQHVTAMVLVATIAFRLVGGWIFRFGGERFLKWGVRFFPLACCSLLLITSQGAPSVVRTFAMYAAFVLLRCRRMEVSPLQLTTSSVACLIVISPPLVASAGFFLSAFATAMNGQVLAEPNFRRQLRGFLYSTIVMPILILPVSAFFFGKVAWLAPLYQCLLGVVWDCVLIPVGFLLPSLAVLPHSVTSFIFPLAEEGWHFIVDKHQWLNGVLGTYYQSCLRPTWSELVLVEILLALIFLRYRR